MLGKLWYVYVAENLSFALLCFVDFKVYLDLFGSTFHSLCLNSIEMFGNRIRIGPNAYSILYINRDIEIS